MVAWIAKVNESKLAHECDDTAGEARHKSIRGALGQTMEIRLHATRTYLEVTTSEQRIVLRQETKKPGASQDLMDGMVNRSGGRKPDVAPPVVEVRTFPCLAVGNV